MSITEQIPNLTGGRLLARNAMWNLAGQLLPMLVGILAIPPLIRSLGVDRFGVLTLAWIVIGYFSFFDLGIGRALTKLVADQLGCNDECSIPPLVWTSLSLMLLLGVAGGLIMLAMSHWLVYSALRVPETLQGETLLGFELLAVSIPLVTVTSGLRGILEAQQRFRVLSFIRVPTSIFSFVGPLLVIPFSRGLVPVIVILIVGRFVGGVAHLLACFHSMPAIRHNLVFQKDKILPLVRYGSWMTVSNIVGPVMVYMDRFLIGALLSVSAVAYYSAPLDLVARLSFISASVTGVLFPAFAVSVVHDRDRAALLVSRGIKYIFVAMFPIILIVIAFAPEGLQLWLGPGFARNSESVLRWLAVGVFVNSAACVPFALIQGAGRPQLTAKLHMLELPLYLLAVWILTKRLGIEGTAIAWSGRVIVDSVLLFFFANKLLPQKPGYLLKVTGILSVALLVFYMSTFAQALFLKAAFSLTALVVFGLASFWGMTPDERDLVSQICERRSMRTQPPCVP